MFQNRRTLEVGTWPSQLGSCPGEAGGSGRSVITGEKGPRRQSQLPWQDRADAGILTGPEPAPAQPGSLPPCPRRSIQTRGGVRADCQRGEGAAGVPAGLRVLPGPVSLEQGAQGGLNLCGLEAGAAEELRGASGDPGRARKAEQQGWFLSHISTLAGNRVGGDRQRPPALGRVLLRM